MANMQSKLKELDSWLRNRLRYCIWTDWKKLERKRKNLIRLGVSQGQAYAWCRTRMGGWAVAQSPIMVTTITLKRLMRKGYESMLNYYERVSPQLNEPLYTRPVREFIPLFQREWCERRTSSVHSGEAVYSIVASWVSSVIFNCSLIFSLSISFQSTCCPASTKPNQTF